MHQSHQYIVILLSVVTSFIFVCWNLRKRPINQWQILLLMFIWLALLIFGAKIFAYYVVHWSEGSPLTWAAMAGSGRRYSGSILAVLLVMPVFIYWVVPKGTRLELADTLALATLIMISLGRYICHVQGCCVGGICNEAYYITYPPLSSVYSQQVWQGQIVAGLSQSLPIFPLHLFIGFSGFLIFLLLYWYNAHKAYAGQIVLFYLLLFHGSKAFLETWREPYIIELQLVSGVIAILGLLGLVYLRVRCRRQ